MIRLLQILLLIGFNVTDNSPISGDKIDSNLERIIAMEEKGSYQSIIDDFLSKNPFVNPFDTVSSKTYFPLCDNTKDTYRCFVDKMDKVSPPFLFAPQHNPKWSYLDCINDSIYETVIKVSLNNPSYFDTEYSNRTYCYSGAYLIDESENYSLILILFNYSAGYEYLLFTINNDGKFIDKIKLGSLDSDYSETFGVLKNLKSGEIITNFLGYDSVKNKLFISKQERNQFTIDNTGRINID